MESPDPTNKSDSPKMMEHAASQIYPHQLKVRRSMYSQFKSNSLETTDNKINSSAAGNDTSKVVDRLPKNPFGE